MDEAQVVAPERNPTGTAARIAARKKARAEEEEAAKLARTKLRAVAELSRPERRRKPMDEAQVVAPERNSTPWTIRRKAMGEEREKAAKLTQAKAVAEEAAKVVKSKHAAMERAQRVREYAELGETGLERTQRQTDEAARDRESHEQIESSFLRALKLSDEDKVVRERALVEEQMARDEAQAAEK
jgi:hypothetical protein